MRWLILVLALSGCDKVFGLQRPPEIDAPADGHDEDLDGIGDLEDNCPGIKNNQADEDFDGVGDTCDPEPAADNDIAMFYSFEAAAQLDWDRISGSWTYVADDLVYRGMNANEQIIARRGAAKMFTPPLVVEARYTVDADPVFSSFGVTAILDAAGSGAACSLRRKADGTYDVLVFRPGQDRPTPIAPLDLAASFTARLTVEPKSVSCDITSDVAGQGGAASVDFDQPRTGPIGFEGQRMNTRTHYIVVYTRAP